MPTKHICLALCISTLLLRCMSTASITGEEPGLGEKKAVFRLTDSTTVRSDAGHHQRIEGGYKVSGLRTKGDWMLDDFDGIIQDSEIREISVTELDAGRTVLAVVAVVGVIASIAAMAEMSRAFSGWGQGSSETIDLEFPN